MDDYDLKRKAELSEKVKDIFPNQYNSINVEEIVQLENEMTKNKDLILYLNDQGIVGTFELKDKLSECFNVFLKKIATKFGTQFCEAIYDFLPDEQLPFLDGLGRSQLASDALAVTTATAELEDQLRKYFFEKQFSEELSPLQAKVTSVSDFSTKLVRAINEEQLLLADVKGKIPSEDYMNEMEQKLNSLTKHILSFEGLVATKVVDSHAISDAKDLNEKLEAMKGKLLDASNSIKKITSY